MFGRKHTAAALVASLGLAAMIGGCRGEATTGSSNIPSEEFASGLRLQTGDVQTGPVALPLPQALSVRVVDAGGQPVAGATVTWAVMSGGGTVNPPTGVSNAQGLVSTTWTLGTTLGANMVRAYLTKGYLLDSATFNATATQGAAVVIALDSTALPPDEAMVASTVTNVRYTVKDQFGYPVPGATATFAVTAGGGSVSPASALSDANGLVSASWTMGQLVGTNSMTATVEGLPVVGVSVEATVDTSRKLALVDGNDQTVAVGTQHAPLVVRVTDRFGNVTAGDTINWTVLSGGGTVDPPRVIADEDGEAATTWTAGAVPAAGKMRAYLTRGELRDSVDFVSDIVAGLPTTISVDSTTIPLPSLRVTTATSGIRFTVLDALGLPVPGATVTFASPNTGAQVTPASAVTNAAGVVTTTWTLGTQAGVQTFTATRAGLPPITLTVGATPDTSRVLTILGGNGQTAMAGNQLLVQLSVAVADRFGNPIAGEVVAFNDSLSSGVTVTPLTAPTDATGEARTTMRLGNALGESQIRVRIASGDPVKHIQRFSAVATMTFRDVYAGNYFACGIGTNDRAYCWGFGQDGQLGNGDLLSTNAVRWPVRSVSDSASSAAPPAFRELAGGRSHTCGVSVARTIFCWGLEVEGRHFPSSASAPVRIPVATESPLLRVNNARTVNAGEAHSCMLTMGGLAYCSGNNERGQLGNGVPSIAARVDTTDGRPRFYSSIVTGERHSCGMRRLDPADLNNLPNVPRPSQQVWCWGLNDRGQLGIGTLTPSDTSLPVQVVLPPGLGLATPVGYDSTSLVAGATHTCALEAGDPLVDRRAFCWGSNSFGQLGKGDSVSAAFAFSEPRLVAGRTFVRLYAGEYHTCGLTSTGAAFCWGRNERGQLTGSPSAPVAAPELVPEVPGLRSMALGELFSCGITGVPGVPGTTAPAGTIWCWGDNEYGQLGLGIFSPNAHIPLAPSPIVRQ